jgi:hypothetical protein
MDLAEREQQHCNDVIGLPPIASAVYSSPTIKTVPSDQIPQIQAAKLSFPES